MHLFVSQSRQKNDKFIIEYKNTFTFRIEEFSPRLLRFFLNCFPFKWKFRMSVLTVMYLLDLVRLGLHMVEQSCKAVIRLISSPIKDKLINYTNGNRSRIAPMRGEINFHYSI